MKKFYFILIAALASIVVFSLKESRHISESESNLREELTLLRKAASRLASTSPESPLGKSNASKTNTFDPIAFLTDLKNLDGVTDQDALRRFSEKYEAQVTSAPVSKLKETCALLEAGGITEHTGRMLTGLYIRIAKSDPDWAIAKLDTLLSSSNQPIEPMLKMLAKDGQIAGGKWDLTNAIAVEKWLNAAASNGRLEGMDAAVSALRADIAAAKGNLSGTSEQLAQLPYTMQAKAAVDLAATLETTAARSQALEQVSTALHFQNFQKFVNALADKSGFEAARDSLTAAKLTPENHDLAAGSIAAANIGPDTKARAAWLLESLRSEDPRALRKFADTWAHANYNETATWMNSLPPGANRDAAVSGFAPVAAKIEGPSAADWAHTITDPLQRNVILSEVRTVWGKQDATAAEAYFKAKPIDTAALEAASK
jgi:hypothetical protein